MIRNNFKSILFSTLILSMIVPIMTVGNNVAVANELDKQTEREMVIQLDQRLIEIEKEIKDTKKQISESSKKGDSQSVDDLKAKLDQLKAEQDQTKARFDQIMKLGKSRITIDPMLEDKLRLVKQTLKNMIIETLTADPETRVFGGLPISGVWYDVESEKLVIVLDDKHPNITSSSMAPKSLEMSRHYEQVAKKLIGDDIPIEIKYDNFNTESCSSRSSDCRPLWGGTRINSNDGGCTLGFRVHDDSTFKVGFVTAGHCETNINDQIGQAPLSSRVGMVTKNTLAPFTNCDCAFVKLDSTIGIEDKVFKGSNLAYDIVGRKTSSTLSINDWVKVSGATTNSIQYGQVKAKDVLILTSNGFVGGLVKTDYTSASGDSGAPVMSLGSTNVDVYGVHIASNGSGERFFSPWEHMDNTLGVH